jgi:hypothetical protein
MRHCKFKYAGKVKVRYTKPTPEAPVIVDIKLPTNLGITENGLIIGMASTIVMWIVIALLL